MRRTLNHDLEGPMSHTMLPLRMSCTAVCINSVLTSLIIIDFVSFPHFTKGCGANLNSGLTGCWINPKYLGSRIAGEYFWLWFTCILNIILYVPLYFYLRGNISVETDSWRSVRIRFKKARSFKDEFGNSFTGSVRGNGTAIEHLSASQQLRKKEAVKMLYCE